jgi:hypothetical protein
MMSAFGSASLTRDSAALVAASFRVGFSMRRGDCDTKSFEVIVEVIHDPYLLACFAV